MGRAVRQEDTGTAQRTYGKFCLRPEGKSYSFTGIMAEGQLILDVSSFLGKGNNNKRKDIWI